MCLYPTLIDNPKYKSNKKNGGVIPHCFDERIKKVPIGCRYCEECRKKKAGEWYIRLENEFRNNKERCRFITLTFNEESLEKYTELARKEIENKNKIDTKSRMSEWEKKNSMEPSIEFVMTMLSGLISEDLSQYLDKVFDIKQKIS